MFVLDTNVACELMRPAPAPTVAAWIAERNAEDLFLTAVSEADRQDGDGADLDLCAGRTALEGRLPDVARSIAGDGNLRVPHAINLDPLWPQQLRKGFDVTGERHCSFPQKVVVPLHDRTLVLHFIVWHEVLFDP